MHSQGMFANLNGYSKINICRLKTNKRAKRGSGGLLIFMKEEITQGIEVIGSRLKSDDRIWLKLCARFFDTKTDVYLCCLYVSPQGCTGKIHQNLLSDKTSRVGRCYYLVILWWYVFVFFVDIVVSLVRLGKIPRWQLARAPSQYLLG